ncbi:hypothetical protein [Flagellimonas lutimaris]|uniref:hypothetical protein n=1 Tax=Flagellimonas lutimaris TaxID=475082 RepID=UPI003F5CDC53
MEKVRVLDRPEDFKKLGINPDVVEQWEDGRRRDQVPGAMENWYFDAIMEDGTKVVVVFLTKHADKRQLATNSPNLRIQITTPDGKLFEDAITVPIEESEVRK